MSEPGFEELQRLWQAPPAAVAPAQKIILRQRRRRWLSQLYLLSEIIATLLGIPFAFWIAFQPGLLLMGLGTLALIIFAAGGSLWARSVRKVRAEDPLLASIDQGVRRARVGVRLAYVSFYVLIASLAFVALLAFMWASAPDLALAAARRMITALAFWCIWFAVALAVTILYLVLRSRELAQMEQFRESMKEEG